MRNMQLQYNEVVHHENDVFNAKPPSPLALPNNVEM